MIEPDTIRLLRECDAGVQMGVSALTDTRGHAQAPALIEHIASTRREHEVLNGEIRELLHSYSDEGKSPNPIARGMSHLKAKVKLSSANQNRAVAELLTDGCHMGIKSLSRYLNQYKAADQASRGIAERLIDVEDRLAHQMRPFL